MEDSLRQEYSYAFAEVKYPGAPEWNVHIIDEKPFSINGVEIIPIRGKHFKLHVLGYRFGNIAYCTDMNHISEEEYSKLQGEIFLFLYQKDFQDFLHLHQTL